VVLDSTFAMAWGRLAVLNMDTRDEAAARSNIGKAIRLSTATTRMEQLYIRFWRSRIFYEQRTASGIADSLIDLYPDEAEPYVLRGMIAEESARVDSAIHYYREALTRDTSYARAVMLLGYAYSTSGEQEKAIGYMQRYIRLAPDLADPRASYADLLLRVGRYQEALEQYERSLELKKDYWYSINKIGDIYSIQGRLREAEAQYGRGLALLPQSSQLEATHMAVVGYLNMQRGEYEKAMGDYRRALGIDSLNYDAAYGMVVALAKLGKFKEAWEVTERIREVLERRNMSESLIMVGFHLMRARVLTEAGELARAREACGDALVHSPPLNRSAIFRQLAEVSFRQKEYEQAFDECEQALQTNPNAPGVLLLLARLYKAQNDSRMTREIGGRLLEIWKNADPDFRDLAELRKLLAVSPPA
jgi:superkiller protein 3